LIKLIAPVAPFFAEEIYANLRVDTMQESIHLLEWPVADKKSINKELEEKMQDVRNLVSQALAERAAAGIRVRQPIASLKIKKEQVPRKRERKGTSSSQARAKIKNNKELLELIKEEVNVKKVVFDNKIKKEIELDTKITEELKEEGIIREVIHCVQRMRKKAGLIPKDKISVQYDGGPQLNKILSRQKAFILKEIIAEDFIQGKKGKFDIKKEVKVDEKKLSLTLKKI